MDLPSFSPSSKEASYVTCPDSEDSPTRAFYDRQLPVLGDRAMRLLQTSRVLLVTPGGGLCGPSLEVARNLILTGIHSLFILDAPHDPHNSSNRMSKKLNSDDLSTCFFATEHDLGESKTECQLGQLKSLNWGVKVDIIRGSVGVNFPVSSILLREYEISCVVVCLETKDCHGGLFVQNQLLFDISSVCRDVGVSMICCEMGGLFAAIFCDFGEEWVCWDTDGEPPVENVIVGISISSSSSSVVEVDLAVEGSLSVLVTVLQDDQDPSGLKKMNHGLQIGDRVRFEGIRSFHDEGIDDIDSSSVLSLENLMNGKVFDVIVKDGNDRFSFYVEVPIPTPTSTSGRILATYVQGTGYCTQVKARKTFCFDSLETSMSKQQHSVSMSSPQILDFDGAKEGWGRKFLYPMFVAMARWKETHDGQAPRTYNESDALEFLQLTREVMAEFQIDPSQLPYEGFYAKLFAYTCRGSLSPFAGLVGGIVSQEVLKAITGKFSPLHQWLFIDAVSVLDLDNLPLEKDAQPLSQTPSRYDGQIRIFGRQFQELLAKQRLFLVGCGALGSEYLKNFAMMGLGCGPEGKIIVTDMDRIEESNLNRQFLFRGEHIGRMKSTCAAEAVKLMNPHMFICPKTDRVGNGTEEIFNDRFWSELDCVVNALDNVRARNYVDEQCVYYGKPLVEAGTLGPKANTQVILPHLTESYSDAHDAAEREFAVCTVKNFPYRIHHTIHWAKNLFVGCFEKSPKHVNAYLEKDDFLPRLRSSEPAGSVKTIVSAVFEDVVNRPKTFDDCVVWARNLFQQKFHDEIAQLLFCFPADKMVKPGVPFWAGDKRCPSVHHFDPSNELHFGFIVSAACLRAGMYGLCPEPGFDYRGVLERVVFEPFRPSLSVTITEEGETDGETDADAVVDDDEGLIESLLLKLPSPGTVAGMRLHPAVFEKDDDSNHHIDFIAAASNLRASNYEIPTLDRRSTKVIAGRIVPALITTTAVATGLGCLELLKIVRGIESVEAYRNAYVNLALPWFSQTEPIPPMKMRGNASKWDIFRINFGRDVTVAHFVEHFRTKYKLSVYSIGLGDSLVFASYMANAPGKLPRRVSELCFEVSRTTPRPSQMYLVLLINCEDESGDEAVVPIVQYQFCNF